MSKIKLASTVIFSRGADEDPEVYLTLRAPELKFFGGYWVFPGGNLNNKIDYHHDSDSLDLALMRCAVREILEEVDILSCYEQSQDTTECEPYHHRTVQALKERHRWHHALE